MAVAGMHRLMDIANEVNHELQRLQALCCGQTGVGQPLALVLDGRHHAVAVMAMLCGLVLAVLPGGQVLLGHVDVMPAGAAPAQVGVTLTQLVGPGGNLHQLLVPFQCQQLIDLALCLRAEPGLGHFGDQAMALDAPCHDGSGDDTGQHAGQYGE